MAEKRGADSNYTSANKKLMLKHNKPEDEEQNAMAVDTCSPQLPDLVVDRVLQLLPTKLAIRASLISKQWAQIWSSLNVEVFHEKDYLSDHLNNPDRRYFLSLLRRRLKQREKGKHDIEKFKLRMRYPGGGDIISKWLNLVANRKVKELDIILRTKRGAYDIFQLPKALLSSKSLTTLNLENVKIEERICLDDSTISLPSLKTLSLKNMHYTNDSGVFQLINSCCPSIECLSLASSKHISSVKITCSSLKSLEVIDCQCLSITVEVVNLESVKVTGKHSFLCLDIASCRLRNIELASLYLGPHEELCTWFGSLDSTFPLLESLVLHECEKLPAHINISHQRLKRLLFHECQIAGVEKVAINTPNLLSFTFNVNTGECLDEDWTRFLSNFSLTAPNLSEAAINLNVKLTWAYPLKS